MIISFTIPGRPQHQGSRTRGHWGGSFDDNRDLNPWRKDAIACALEARPPDLAGAVFLGPVEVRARFVFPRLKGHYGSGKNARVLKESAPVWVITKPDTDHCQRALGDVLTFAGIVRDDNQIVRWVAEKVYGDLPCVEAHIVPLAGDELARHLMDELVTA
jgi:Holliday junction resolvase RusA-like endonuclease